MTQEVSRVHKREAKTSWLPLNPNRNHVIKLQGQTRILYCLAIQERGFFPFFSLYFALSYHLLELTTVHS